MERNVISVIVGFTYGCRLLHVARVKSFILSVQLRFGAFSKKLFGSVNAESNFYFSIFTFTKSEIVQQRSGECT